ncbi:MAG: MarR family transcriptional regulator [Acidobacteriota bacterium]
MASSPDPVLELLRLLWGIEHGLQRASKRMSADLGITGPQRLVLRIVSRSPGISAGDVAHLVQLDPSTLTGILQRLVRKGLLRRERHPEDSRRVRLRTQPKARPFLRPSAGLVESAVAGVLADARPAELRHARAVLYRIAAALEGSNPASTRVTARRPRATGHAVGRH